MADQISVAFVCLGNICRSPMAEAVFAHKVKELGYSDRFKRIDSFGTAGYHVGEDPDHRSSATCKKHGVLVKHRGQQFKANDFKNFDYVIAMDEENKRNLLRIMPKTSNARVELFGEWNTEPGKFSNIVEDPYYGGINGFEHNFEQVSHFSENFLEQEVGQV
ncbi:hypothetical protein BABINDRAFT_38768 [Babjeviella inositovora NRRL Y-12698]|uniref:Phosphotyrosine protein phosphatase I domain-containing protein n=1 Tax=Babjeviella inositovora NRRL Y-12698 TaxID=984486 RepID=A0A1E3QNN7_9ASCO|nr:uncharacterized protein BABINDRAFT_38768 [Babjeviella inositovora NRRL Y-12698]ODQ78702.1 hypothetical protein BABINDRAFT_38768 [Babjeviella inositovora NRRL Y-12698]